MDLLREYDFEALPYVDKEYDIPAASNLVNSMILKEMQSFTSLGDVYLQHLPYPSFTHFNSLTIQSEISRLLQKGHEGSTSTMSSSSSLNTARYNVDPPNTSNEKVPEEWTKSINNAKSQFQHQRNRLLNTEIASEFLKQDWLAYNSQLDAFDKYLSNEIGQKKRKIAEVNVIRKVSQEKTKEDLDKILYERDRLVNTCYHLKERIQGLMSDLSLEKRKEFEEILLDLQRDADVEYVAVLDKYLTNDNLCNDEIE